MGSTPPPTLPAVDLGSVSDPHWSVVISLLGPIILAVISSGVVTQWLIHRFSAKANKKEKRRDDASEALEVLREFRRTILTYGNQSKPKATDAERDTVLATLGNDLVIACAKSPEDVTTSTAEDYIAVAQLFAAQDPDTGAGAEAKAFRGLLDQITSSRDKQL